MSPFASRSVSVRLEIVAASHRQPDLTPLVPRVYMGQLPNAQDLHGPAEGSTWASWPPPSDNTLQPACTLYSLFNAS